MTTTSTHPIPPSLPALLLLLVLLARPSPTSAVSTAARRVQTTFLLINSPTPTNASSSTVPSQGAPPPACPRSFTFTRVATYRGINPADPSGEYDGVLWRDLRVDDVPCLPASSPPSSRTSTYFVVPPPPPPDASPSEASPWFLQGRDNAALSAACQPQPGAPALSLPLRYFWTDDAPRFAGRLEGDGLLADAAAAAAARRLARGDALLVAVGADAAGDVVARAKCAYVERAAAATAGIGAGDGAGAGDAGGGEATEGASTPVPAQPAPDTPAETPPTDDAPACLSGRMRAASGAPFSALQVGAALPAPRGWGRAGAARGDWMSDDLKTASGGRDDIHGDGNGNGSDGGDDGDVVLAFSHREERRRARFVALALERCARSRGGRATLCSNATLEASAGHLLVAADGGLLRAGDVAAGDQLLAARRGADGVASGRRDVPDGVLDDALGNADRDGEATVRVRAVRHVWADGVYAPVTRSGMLEVAGVVVTCYTDAVGGGAGHALMAAARAAARVGAVGGAVLAVSDGARALAYGC